MFINSVDLKRNQQRKLDVMRIRAEQQAPDYYASELAEARWQIGDLTKKLEEANRTNRALQARIALLQLEYRPHAIITQMS